MDLPAWRVGSILDPYRLEATCPSMPPPFRQQKRTAPSTSALQRPVQKWAALAPDHFLFWCRPTASLVMFTSWLAPSIHGCTFLTNAARLQSHLGPILLQLAPSFYRRQPVLERFLDESAEPIAKGLRLAIEFRHESWFAADIYDCWHVITSPSALPMAPNTPERMSSQRTSPISDITGEPPPVPTIPIPMQHEAGMIRRRFMTASTCMRTSTNDAEAKTIKNSNSLRALVS